MEPTKVAVERPRIWFRDFTYYCLSFGIIFAVLSSISYSDSDTIARTGGLLQARLMQAAVGFGYGAILAVVFSLLQNGLNSVRRRWVSWILVIVTLIIGAFGRVMLTA